jgi:hypothetical protein
LTNDNLAILKSGQSLRDAKERDFMLRLEGFCKEERAYLPPKMLKCLSKTDNLGQMLKLGKKK